MTMMTYMMILLSVLFLMMMATSSRIMMVTSMPINIDDSSNDSNSNDTVESSNTSTTIRIEDIDMNIIIESERFVSNVWLRYEQSNCSSWYNNYYSRVRRLSSSSNNHHSNNMNEQQPRRRRRKLLFQEMNKGMNGNGMKSRKGGMICICRLLHDLAKSSSIVIHDHGRRADGEDYGSSYDNDYGYDNYKDYYSGDRMLLPSSTLTSLTSLDSGSGSGSGSEGGNEGGSEGGSSITTKSTERKMTTETSLLRDKEAMPTTESKTNTDSTIDTNTDTIDTDTGIEINVDNYIAAVSAQTIEFESNCIYKNKKNQAFALRLKPIISKNFGNYICENIDLLVHIPLKTYYIKNKNNRNVFPEEGSDVWGWSYVNETSKDVREFIIWAVDIGNIFIEITDPIKPILIGSIPSGISAFVRDVKVLGNFAYMIDDNEAGDFNTEGLRIFDLTILLDIDVNPDMNSEYDKYSGINFTPDVISYNGNDAESGNTIDIAHNIVTNSDTNMIYLVGGSRFVASNRKYVEVCSGGLYMIDVSDPLQPKYVGCYGGDNYVHDAECVIYEGPDTEYVGHEICFCFNENSITIVDVTDKKKPRQLSKTRYKQKAYTHQGWLSSNQNYIIFNDEVDEIKRGFKTRTMVYDITNLTDPTNFQEYSASTNAVDHNLYVVNAQVQGYIKDVELIYQANYRAGLRVLKVNDYSTANFEEIGYFDMYPTNDDPDFVGAFSVYPFFNKSGRQTIVVSTVREGLFILKPNNTFTNILTPDTSSPTNNPTVLPSSVPSTIPSTIPTSFPSYVPTESPTNNPTVLPSSIPSSVPSSVPSTIPTSFPSYVPTDLPSTATMSPSVSPTDLPTDPPSTSPTALSSKSPTDSTTASPTALPTGLPSDSPSDSPTTSQTALPTDSPSDSPSNSPTTSPTTLPTDSPSDSPTDSPTTSPAFAPRGDCDNLTTYLYENRDNKDCNGWVAKRPKKRCKKKDSFRKNKKVRKFCPSVCKEKCKEAVAQNSIDSPATTSTSTSTSAPRGDCENLTTYLYENRDNKDCDGWVATKPNKRCKKNDFLQKNKKVRYFCPSICKDKCK